MKTTSAYTKKDAQIKLESILDYFVNGLHINSITEVETLAASIEFNPEINALYTEFKEALKDVIYDLANEVKIHKFIKSFAQEHGSPYDSDQHQYQFFFEVINNCYDSLFKTIKRTGTNSKNGQRIVIDNTGRTRIDTYLDKPIDAFVPTLRTYLSNNIIKDSAKRHKTIIKHYESDTIEPHNDAEDSIFKADSILYNHDIDFDFENRIVSRMSYPENFCSSLIVSAIERLRTTKPVGCYVFMRIMTADYDVRTIVSELNNIPFNDLMHNAIRDLEREYPVDLSHYYAMTFNAEKYISSFRKIAEDETLKAKEIYNLQRSRIDRLASDTRKIVHGLPVFDKAASDFITYSSNKKYYSL